MSTNHNESVRSLLKVYFIMGSVNCRKDPREVLTEAIAGGITLFQFREKGVGSLVGKAKLTLARELQQICQKYHIPFIVNDDIDLAIAVNADGVHVGQEDEPASSIRERIGSHKIIGVSAHTLEEAQQAIKDGAHYLGVGPIFPTRSKDDAREVLGTTLLHELRQQGISIPLVGIGGISIDNAASVIAAGADGVSVISAIASSNSIKEAAAVFVSSLNNPSNKNIRSLYS
ncbi:thiamine phosphate synthase [Paenibacillus sp. IHBB 10380]|uniref:thiamine phosphate synthase n=1 Tax=Paenibacillus sp. IHBB 10380 TaxID=1566358 RepID=UPI0005CFA31A|nr:thiamine phosphate synthase [Paenibacillus sp. IHBB 10380]AJS57326.1 thiamine-phosphate pyrophosphorylase [Paenibacillus sp. IHBB 10380]